MPIFCPLGPLRPLEVVLRAAEDIDLGLAATIEPMR